MATFRRHALGLSTTYRIAIGPQQGRKEPTLQMLPAHDEPFDEGVGKVVGFSLHAGVAVRTDHRVHRGSGGHREDPHSRGGESD